MTALQDLIRQREALDAEIRQRQKELRDTWNDRLTHLHTTLESWAMAKDFTIMRSTRKNVEKLQIVNLSGTITVSVDFGYYEEGRDDWGPWFGIRSSSGLEFTVSGGLPDAALLVALVGGLLNPSEG